MRSFRFLSAILFSAMFLVVCGVCRQAHCQDDTYSLMVQQAPVDAGTVTPGPGIHRIGISNAVTLTAMPKPGYRFMYWMGDVGDMSANETVVVIDSPKIVVAVFERTENELLVEAAGVGKDSRGGGGGGEGETPGIAGNLGFLTPTPSDVVISHTTNANSGRSVTTSRGGSKSLDTETVIIPSGPLIPEPATLMLLGAGGLLLLRKRR